MKINVYTDKNLLSYLAKGWSEDKLINGKIKTLTGRTIAIESVENSWTVFQFKRAIEDKEGIPVEKQTLKKGKTLLEDKHPISEYFLTDGSTLLMFIEGEGVDFIPSDSSSSSSSSTHTRERPVTSQVVVLDPAEEGSEESKNENWWEKSQMSGPKSAPKLRPTTDEASQKTKEEEDEQRALRLKAIEARMKR